MGIYAEPSAYYVCIHCHRINGTSYTNLTATTCEQLAVSFLF